MARYHGKNGRVYMSTTNAGAATSLGNVSDWSISFTRDQVETTSMGDSNKQYVMGMKDAKGTLSGFWDNAVDTLFTAAALDDSVRIFIYPAAIDTKYWYGYAFVDVSVSSGVTAAVKTSCNFVAAGAWGYV
jgi:hypothetical protein